tara:strand:+ start:634 stop:2019 length:1386 start_codon:yes stop_codon:yes gene_type:complete
MALIDRKSDITSFNYDKVGKNNADENKTFRVNQGQNTGKETGFDTQTITNTEYNKLKPDDGQLITKKIGERYGGTKNDDGFFRGGIALQTERTADDVERIGKFLFTEPKGILFNLKQQVLQNNNESGHTRDYKITSPITNLSPLLRDERHKASGLNPFEDSPKYSDEDILKKNVGSDYNKSNRVNQIILKKGNKTKPSKRAKIQLTSDAASRSYLNLPFISKDKFDTKNIPKDFIDFRIYDKVNKKYIIFPAYLSDITDNSSAEYTPTRYIGRADQVFVYTGYTRSISFGFRVCALTKDDIPIMWQKIDKLKALTLPTYSQDVLTGDKELRPIAPIVELTIGNMFRNTTGYFGSIGVNITENSTWETEDGHQLPILCDVTCEFTYIGNHLPMNSGNATQYDRTTINSTTEPDFSDIKANLDKGIPSSVELDVDVTDSFEATQRRELKEIESNPLLRNSGIV